MGQHQDVEVKVEQPSIRVAEPASGAGRIVHVAVRHESERLGIVHHPVGAGQRAVGREVQRGLIGTDHADLMGDRSAGKLVAEVKSFDRSASVQLVDAVADAVHRAAESLLQLPRMAVVMTVRQQHVLGRSPFLEPLQTLGRDHRIEHHALRLEKVRADLDADALVSGRPVPDPGRNLLWHGPSIPLALRRRIPARQGPQFFDSSTIIPLVDTLSVDQLEGAALEAWRNYLQSHASIVRDLDAELLAAHGMTTRDYQVLLYLAQAPHRRLPMSALATSTMLTRSGITRLVDGLVHAGYIERVACPNDARISYARLTDAGYEKLREAGCTHVSSIQRLFLEHFTPEEVQQLASLLSRLPGAGSGESCTVSPEPS